MVPDMHHSLNGWVSRKVKTAVAAREGKVDGRALTVSLPSFDRVRRREPGSERRLGNWKLEHGWLKWEGEKWHHARSPPI